MDALIALTVIFVVILTMRPSITQKTTEMHIQDDILLVLSTLKIGELNTPEFPRVQNFVASGDVTLLNQSVLRQIGAFYAVDSGAPGSNSRLLTNDIINYLSPKEKIGLWFDGTEIAVSSSYSNQKQIWTARQLVSGIQNGTNVTGFTATATLSSSSKVDYYYFGGYVGEGNITAQVEYYGDIQNVTVEGELVGDFDLYVNDVYQLSSSGVAGSVTIFPVPSSDFHTGKNYVRFSSEDFYISGGFIKVIYENSSNLYSPTKKYKFPGINGIINIYDSFYIPGAISEMSMYLNFTSDFETFLNIGNVTIVNQTNPPGSGPIQVTNAQFSNLFSAAGISYADLVNKTIPLRFGMENVSYISTISRNADVFSVTDLSGSMSDNCGGCQSDCNTCAGDCKICDAKDANYILFNEILNDTLNRVGLTGYESDAYDRDFHMLSKINQSLTEEVGNIWDASGWTCICCGIEDAVAAFTQSEKIVSYYKFDNDVLDYSGQGNDGTFNGGTALYLLGVNNSAINFDGTNDYVNAGNPDINLRGSISFWFKLNNTFNSSVPLTQALWGKYLNGDNDAFLSLKGQDMNNGGPDGRLQVKMEGPGGGGAVYVNSATNNFVKDTWYHVALVWGSGVTRLYVNGAQEDIEIITAPRGIGYSANNEIGRSYYDAFNIAGGGPRYLNGSIDEFRMYNRILTLSEVQALASSSPVCGDYLIQAGEVCDGDIQFCNSGMDPGTQLCNGNCQSYSSCNLEPRYQALIVMSDGITNVECTPYNLCGNDPVCMNRAAQDAISAACDAYNNYGIITHAVGFGDDVNESTLQAIASCSGSEGTYYFANVTEIASVYQNISQTILQATYSEQRIIASEGINTTLSPDSYIQFNYSAPQLPPGLIITVESPRFGNSISEGNFIYPSDSRLIEANVVSYSGSLWTHNVTISNSLFSNVFNLAQYGSNYIVLGDPYVINIPNHLVEFGNNLVRTTLGVSPTNLSGGSPQNKIIYKIAKDKTGFGDIRITADGCIWHIEFDDGDSTVIRVPDNYAGASECWYNSTSIIVNENDAIDSAVKDLLDQLDIDGDQRIDAKFTEQEVKISTNEIQGVPFAWSTEVQARVWR
ncbi:MAG: LamG-like jellyroll fold domain-containing protein [archaeon]